MSNKPRDKRMTIDEVVAELEDGMTIGIGGWGPRRKPMALVRAILRSDLKDLTLVSWGGADVGLLVRAGKVRKLVYAFVSLDSVPLEPNFQKARQEGTIPEVVELDEGMFQTGLRAAAQRLPFLPMRAGLGSDVLVNNPWIRTVTSPYDDGREELVAVPALNLDVALVHLNRADQHGNATYLGPDPYFDDLFCMAADRAYVTVEQIVDTAGLTVDTPVQRLLLSRMMVSRRRRDAERRALHDLHARLRARREVPAGVRRRGRRHRRGLGGVRGALPVRRRGRLPSRGRTRSPRRRRHE